LHPHLHPIDPVNYPGVNISVMVSLTLESVCAPSDEVVTREIEDEFIIVPITSNIGNLGDELYSLNETGRAIWQLFDGKRTIHDVAINIAKTYLAPLDLITRDIMGLAMELEKMKILVCQ
jgi:hypothetical protein